MQKYGMTFNNRTAGFTMIELAVALLIAGFVLSGIWVAAKKTMTNYGIQKTNRQIATVVQNIRGYYSNTTNEVPCNYYCSAAVIDVTDAMDKKGIFPSEMHLLPRRGAYIPGSGTSAIANPVHHSLHSVAWSTNHATQADNSFKVYSIKNSAGKYTTFRIALEGLNKDTCMRLLMQMPINDSSFGIVRIGTNMGNSVTSATSTGNLLSSVNMATASAWCNQGGGENEVDIEFKLYR
ncbi:MAG: prepilin-type N-terminal cleavage/methylation domain-containing protein [Alphaproteobacteria bacterium]|nr:prepilin-type N-terminal cleavage/methylation domain-containing protein [Alphaproteobacteria bacterium]